MILTVNNLNEIIVKVDEGSGVILKLEDKAKCYVLTAYHNIETSIDNEEDIIVISEDKKKHSIIGNPYYNKDEDIAILEIENLDQIPNIRATNSISPDDDITFMGYPDKAKGERKRLNGKVIEWNSTKTAINVVENIQGSNVDKEKTNEVLVGYSGAAVFRKNSEELSLVGIIKSLPEENFDYKEIKCIPLKAVLELLQQNSLGILQDNTAIMNEEDVSSIDGWEQTQQKDTRNLRDKLRGICLELTDSRIGHYNRKVSMGKVEQDRYDERQLSALRYIIFEECQDELMQFYENNIDKEYLSITELRDFLIRYLERAKLIIEDKKKIYSYPNLSDDFVNKLILDLIDECYLSFDKEGIYSD